jgi:quinol monooxygenase YgiN
MNSKLEYDSEHCNVRYIENDNVVFLTWKKFARLDDYRNPTLFALDLLKQYPHSNFVVDATNGFEDDIEDVKWGFSYLLPNMAKTDCKYVVFIMQQADAIQDEMDMWTKEFGKYFAVVKANSFEQAVSKIYNRILVNVRYTIRPGKRDEFLEKVNEQGIIVDSRAEPGNYQYEYYKPVDSDNILFLMEMWVDSKAQEVHGKAEHYQRLQALKKEYVTDVAIQKYNVSELL